MRAARVDLNQPEIVRALRAAGAHVTCTHTVGGGFVDLVCGYRGQTLLLECKMPKGYMTDDQIQWHGTWIGGPLAVVTDVEGALRALRVLG